MNFITNVSYDDIKTGNHPNPGENSMLIQIVDPSMVFPKPKHEFKEVHKFQFLDLEEDDPCGNEFKITDEQARQLVELLKHALEHDMNVICHCHAGICRSGAVVEVGVMMGFQDLHRPRLPNMLVKQKMMKVLGWTYDEICPS